MGVSQLVGLIGGGKSIAGTVGGIVGDIAGIFGGKPDLRPAREDELYAMVANHEPYAVQAAQILWWRHSSPGSKADAAENAVVWGKLASQFPDIAAQAQARGPLTDTVTQAPNVPVTGSYRPGQYPSTQQYDAARADLGNTVQRLGAAGTNAASNAINPGGGLLTIPTNIGTLLLLAVGVIVIVMLMRRGGR